MVTVAQILKENNLEFSLKEGLLSLELEGEYIFHDCYLEPAEDYDCPCDEDNIKAFLFKEVNQGENIVLYPEMKLGTLWVSKKGCYYDENGECYLDLEID